MAQADSLLDSNNKPEETIKEATCDAHLYEKNPATSKTKQISNNTDLVKLSTEVTPMYIKNPMYAKNRLSAAIESVANANENGTKEDRSFLIEPSPSGVTRIKINNFDVNNNQLNNNNNNINNSNAISTNYTSSSMSNYCKPITVQFTTANPHYPVQFNTFHSDLSQKPIGIITNPHLYQAYNQNSYHNHNMNNNKIDTCTSPIRILNANYEEAQIQKDAFTRIEQPEAVKIKKDSSTEPVLNTEEPQKTGIFVKNKELKTNLEKSKLIVVNVTPKTSKKEFEELSIPLSPKTKQAFEIDMDTDVVVKTNEPHLNESVAEIPLQAPGSNPNFHHLQQSNQTPILTSMLKQQKIIDRKSDPNEILNLESNCYYDNIIKLKQINEQPQVVFRKQTELASANNAFEPDQLHQQEQPQQPEFNYNKLIEKLNETNKNLSINQRDQCLQFPTPGALIDQSKKLPRMNYSQQLMNTESKTGFFNMEINSDENKFANERGNLKSSVETFYDGSKVWTANTNIFKQESSEEDNNMDDLDGIYSAVSKKKNVQVKIKLPNETVSEIVEPTHVRKAKKRNGQRCCYFMFIFILLLIVLGIVVYFFAWDVIIKRNIFN